MKWEKKGVQGWVRGFIKKVKRGKCEEKWEEYWVKFWEKMKQKKRKKKESCGKRKVLVAVERVRVRWVRKGLRVSCKMAKKGKKRD